MNSVGISRNHTELCVRDGDDLRVPNIRGRLTVVCEGPDGLLGCKEEGRFSGRGWQRTWVRGKFFVARLRPFKPGDTLNTAHLDIYDRQVLETFWSWPLSRGKFDWASAFAKAQEALA